MSIQVIFAIGVGVFLLLTVVRRLLMAKAAKQLIADGALVIDVRTQQEFNGGHIERAHLIPVQELEGRLKEVEKLAGEKIKPIVVYCRSGARSGHAKIILSRAGFTAVTNGGAYAALAGR